MASARRWSVSGGRTVVSGVLIVLAFFLLSASLSAGSWLLAALAAAMIAAAVAFYVVAALNSREFAYIPGTAHVVSCSPPPAAASQGRCEMHLVIHAPGIDDVAVKIRDAGVPVSKWPDAGSTLPILVAVGDPRRVRVLWDSVRSHGEVAEGRDQEYAGTPAQQAYLNDLLDEEYDDEPSMAGLDPDAPYIEMEIMPARDSGPGFSPGINYNPDIGMDPDVALSHEVDMAGPDPDQAEPAPEPERLPEPDRLPEPERLAEPEPLPEPLPEPVASAEAQPQPRPHRPSPRPRRPADDQIPSRDAGAEAAGNVVTLPPQPSRAERDESLPPLRVEQMLPADPAVPAIPDAQEAEDSDVSEAYLSVSAPPGQRTRARVRGVGVTLFVTNLGRSLGFYRDLLGFRQVDMGLGTAVLESGDARIVLRRVVDMPPVDRRLVHLLLEVPDVQAAYDELLLQGVEFVHRPRPVSRYEQLELWSAAFRDPDGHGIALTKWEVRH